MRSPDVQQLEMFSYVSVESRVPADHPIRKLRVLVDTIFAGLDTTLAARYADNGRPSIPPERLLRASLLQVVYSIPIVASVANLRTNPPADHKTGSDVDSALVHNPES